MNKFAHSNVGVHPDSAAARGAEKEYVSDSSAVRQRNLHFFKCCCCNFISIVCPDNLSKRFVTAALPRLHTERMPALVLTVFVTAFSLDSMVAPLDDTLRMSIISLTESSSGPRTRNRARAMTFNITGIDVSDKDFLAHETIASSIIV